MQQVPAPLAGGLLLSFATSKLLLDQGRILGCSGIAHSTTNRLISTFTEDTTASKGKVPQEEGDDWKVAAVLGLVAGGLALSHLRSSIELVVGQPILDPATSGLLRPILAGLAVGAGTKVSYLSFLLNFRRVPAIVANQTPSSLVDSSARAARAGTC
jgi:hypothetical protein